MARKFAGLKLSAALAATALVLTACGSSEGDGEATAGGTLTFLTQAEQTLHLDPQRNYTGLDLAFANTYMQRTLTAYNPAPGEAGTEIIPDLATDLGTPNADATEWSFTLRDGGTFEDGSAITCADVAYGVSRIFATDIIVDGPTYAITMLDIPKAEDGSSAYKGPYTGEGQDLYDSAVTCSEDNKTITFKLAFPVADFNYTVTLLAFSPVPAALDTGESYDDKPVSSGPYKIQEYTKGTQLVLVRNEEWSKDSDPFRKALPDSVVIKYAQDPELVDEALINGIGDGETALGLDHVFPTNLATVFNDPALEDRRLNEFDPYVRYFAFNVSKLPCVEVRKAIYYALDREGLLVIGGGELFYGTYGDGLIKPTGLPADYQPITGYEDILPGGNPEKATELLEAAKTSCPDVYAKVTGEGIIIDLAKTPTSEKSVAVWTDSLAAAGIKATANLIEPGQYYGVVLNPDQQGDLSSAGWGPDWLNASTVVPELVADGGFNLSRNQDDPAYADFVARSNEAKRTTDRAAQGAIWAELNQTTMDNAWVLPTFFTKTQYLWGSRVTGVYMWNAYGSPSFNDMGVVAAE
jgi:peptide/nickel transport system substrate-binding protein